jgi:thiamine-monophosphate kinase
VPDETARYLCDRYVHPQPRLALAPLIRAFATSAMDVSDGLVGDLGHICDASGVGATIEAVCVPLSDAAKEVVAKDAAALLRAITGGDDYEILATIPENRAVEFADSARAAGVSMTRIGHIDVGSGPPVVVDVDGKIVTFETLGHTHF